MTVFNEKYFPEHWPSILIVLLHRAKLLQGEAAQTIYLDMQIKPAVSQNLLKDGLKYVPVAFQNSWGIIRKTSSFKINQALHVIYCFTPKKPYLGPER